MVVPLPVRRIITGVQAREAVLQLLLHPLAPQSLIVLAEVETLVLGSVAEFLRQ